MMTPKEKAIELHNRILNITFDDRDIPGEPTWVSTKCALIAVDEMLNYFSKETFMMAYPEIAINEIEYWQEVKQEIEAL